MKLYNFSVTRFLYKWKFVIALCFAVVILLLQGCSKNGPLTPTQDLYQKYFEENVLNKDFIVSLANDNGTDITAQYSGWIFKLLKNTYLDGPMTAIKNGVTYTGTWACNEDYGKLTISINQPTIPPAIVFINRSWRFTKKDLPVMELAPWGSTEPSVLHMKRL